MSHNFVVTVANGGSLDLFGPFDSRNAAWAFANRLRCARPRDESMPAVDVQPVHPGRLGALHL